MLRRTFILLTALMMLCSVCLGETADTEERTLGYTSPFDCWQGRIGNIAFALPAMPTAVTHEVDVEGYWTDSIQFWGDCIFDGAEYQLRSADIAPWIEGYIKDNPEDDPRDCKYRALYSYAAMMLASYDGETSVPQVNDEEGLMTFTYTFADTPDSTYQAKCLIDGTLAVCLTMEDCDHTEEAMSRLVRMTDEEQAAWEERTPVTIDFYGIRILFPHEPLVTEQETLTSANCFADDYTRMIAQYYPIEAAIDDPEEAKETMDMLAGHLIHAVGGGNILEGTEKTSEANGYWTYDFAFLVDHVFNEYWPEDFTWLARVYFGEEGIWFFMCNNTDTGADWLAGIGDYYESSFDSLIRMDGDILNASPRAADGSPATLKQFCKELTGILQADTERGAVDPEAVMLGNAVWSDGQWVRVLQCGDPSLYYYMVLYLSSDTEDAVINELHIIAEENEVAKECFPVMASCGIQAAEGSEDPAVTALREKEIQTDDTFNWKGTRYEAELSYMTKGSHPYQLMTVKALQPASLEHEPGEWRINQNFAVPAKTVSQFCEKWAALDNNVFGGTHQIDYKQIIPMDDMNYVHLLGFGSGTFIMLTTESEDEDTAIINARVISPAGNAPETYLGGVMTLAVITDMPAEQYVLLTMKLHEHPLWQDLCEMLPIAGWNGKLVVVCENETGEDDQTIPAAYIMDLPMNN